MLGPGCVDRITLDIMGKAHALLEDIYKSAPEPTPPKRR